MMRRARSNPSKANWIPTDVCDEVCHIWDGPEYKKKREQGRKNRASMDGFSHTGGSIPCSEYHKRMRVKLGQNPINTEKNFNKLKEEMLAQQSISSISESPHEPLDESSLFIKVVGGLSKKGRVYGLGSEARCLHSASFCSSGHSKRLYTQEECDQELEERVAQMNSELLDEVINLRQRMPGLEHMARMNSKLQDEVRDLRLRMQDHERRMAEFFSQM
ncbi:uncharacterized protein LOC120009381 isoform X2 [Tripterygium wilfordii]|nr:uncharacterized protein LOC120009381 isoform X2 [Tripterygium wilfordii]XP_038717495.1 uncharacterized protein LOC120009381 isoform X2 [Tripterygium wilfordii]